MRRFNDSYPTSIRLPPDLLAFIDKEAMRQERTRAWLIVEVLQQYRAFKQAKSTVPFQD